MEMSSWLALDEFRKMKFSEVVSNASAENVTSVKVIENNGGVFIKEINGSRYYKIELYFTIEETMSYGICKWKIKRI